MSRDSLDPLPFSRLHSPMVDADELWKAREYIDALPAGRLRDDMFHLARGTATEARACLEPLWGACPGPLWGPCEALVGLLWGS